MNFFNQKNKAQTYIQHVAQGGFTLIELLVVIAIFGIILSVALFDQGKLNNNVLVTNLAYEIALSVREAQAYGIGVRSNDVSSGFQGGYGLSFDMRNPNQIVLFNDKNDDHLFEGDEEVSRYTIENQRGNTITAICINTTTACTPANSTGVINIIYKRPNPEAIFSNPSLSSGAFLLGATNDNLSGPVYIVVNTPSGDNCRDIAISQSGEISVENSSAGHCVNN